MREVIDIRRMVQIFIYRSARRSRYSFICLTYRTVRIRAMGGKQLDWEIRARSGAVKDDNYDRAIRSSARDV